MYDYTMIDSDTKLDAMLAFWKDHHIDTVAMDFEGEFNLHIYGEHLCLVQLYDGATYFLVDPFAVSTSALKRLLESEDLEKIMFDCSSDAALVRKESDIWIKRIHDVRISAKLLGYEGNLGSLVQACTGRTPDPGKKGNQTANWLVRPLKTKLIEYALSDVEHLFAIRSVLDKKVAEAGLSEQAARLQANAGIPNGPDKPGWEKLDGYRYLSRREQVFVRCFFEARDSLARSMNVPAVQILEKRHLVSMAKQVPSGEQEFRAIARNRDGKITNKLVVLLMQAKQRALEELGQG
jgi:ribonuclease D